MYYQKIYRCRKTVWVEKYQRRVYAKGEKRSERKAPTPEQKKKENDLQAKRLLARKLEANFGEDDYFVTLTYKGDAPNQEEAKQRLDKFLRGIRLDYRKLGSELKYIVVTEWQGKAYPSPHCYERIARDTKAAQKELATWTTGHEAVRRVRRL